MNNLNKDLLGFEFLSAQSKIELWLCYKDLKPVSAFPFSNTKKVNLKRAEDKLTVWSQEAGLIFTKDHDSNLYIVSKVRKNIDDLLPIIFSNKEQDIVTKCNLYGYPKETSLAAYRNFSVEKDGLPKGVGIVKDNVFKISWWPYVRYIVREGFEYEDSLTAKAWQEEIKKSMPELDKEFEEVLARII